MDSMRNIIPGLSEVRTGFTHDRRLTLQFVEAGVGRPWTSEEVSDGTIQSLALFTVLHDPRAPLVFIEEPENSVHPWIVRAFVDACRNTKKEVVVTTHSPALIDYLKPDEITLVWRDAGRTELRRLVDLDPQAQELWAKGEASPFEILDSGWIRQGVPEGFA
jgi:predicted ATPase